MYGVCIVILITLLALVLAVFNHRYVREMKEGTAEMSEMAGIIRDDADAFMRTEYKTIVITVAAVAVIFLLLIEWSSAITFVLGAAMSSAACIFGMKVASYVNVRTANRARSGSMHRTMKVALGGMALRYLWHCNFCTGDAKLCCNYGFGRCVWSDCGQRRWHC